VSGGTFAVPGGSLKVETSKVTARGGEYGDPYVTGLNCIVTNQTDRVISSMSLELVGYRSEGGAPLKTGMGEKVISTPVIPSGRFGPGDQYQTEASIASDVPGLTDRSVFKIQGVDINTPADYNIALTEPDTSDSLSYSAEDGIQYSFDVRPQGISLVLINTTGKPIEIDWSKASFVDLKRTSHEVVYSGIKYSEKNKPLQPTTVAPRAKVRKRIVPKDNIRYDQTLEKWTVDPILPEDVSEAKNTVGRTLSLYLPVRLGDEAIRNNFTFQIRDVSPTGAPS
jgi:hypothetical protein